MNLYRVADPAILTKRGAEPDMIGRVLRTMADPTAELPPDLERIVEAPSRELAGYCSSQSVVVPWSALARDLTTSVASGTQKAGYLATDAPASPVSASLRPFSVVAAAGATMLEMAGTAARRLPIVSSPIVAEWVTEQGPASVEGGGLAFTSASIAAREVCASVKLSRRLSKQAEVGVESLVRNELLSAIGRALDKAVLAGDGSLEPQGIVGTAGVIAQSGTTLNRTGCVTMLNAIAATGIRRDRVSFVLPPATATVLQGREVVAAGGRYVLEDDSTIVGRPALVTPEAPAATVVAGDFAQCLVGVWGGIWLQTNPYVASSKGEILVDVRLVVGVAFPRPGTFAVATSVN